MDVNIVRLGETVYALVEKSAIAMGNDESGEVFVMPGVVIGVHVNNGIDIRCDDFVFNVPADHVFYNRIHADDAAEEYNAQRKNAEPEGQEYMVCIRVTGRVLVPAKALDPETARCRANGKVCDMDFGPLEDIDWDGVYCEDANGNRTDY